MLSQLENFLNCRDHLKESLPIIIEGFVDFYGEERREEIESKFSKALYYAYRSPKSLELLLRDIETCVSQEILEKYQIESKTSLSLEDLMDRATFRYENILPIYAFRRFYELYKLGPEGREKKFREDAYESIKSRIPFITKEEYEEMVETQRILPKYEVLHPILKDDISYYIDMRNVDKKYERAFEQAQPILQKVNPGITINNYSYYLDQEELQSLIYLGEQYPRMVEEYQERMKKYAPYLAEEKFHEALEERLKDKYLILLIENNLDLLGEEDIRSLEKAKKEKPKYLYSSLSKNIQFLFGYGLTGNHPIESFGTAAEEILTSTGTTDWEKKKVKENRVKYFQMKGLDLGEDYAAYEKSEEAKQIAPTEERVKQFQETRLRLLNEYNIDFYSNTPLHQEVLKELEEKKVLDKDDCLNASLYLKKMGTETNPNLIQAENGYELFTIIAIRCYRPDCGLDHSIIHEMNHLFELSLKEVKGNHYIGLCGWDELHESFNQDEKSPVDTLHEDETKRNYELFNEIINELIAQDIHKKMIEKHRFIFNTEEDVEYKGQTSYEHTWVLVKFFYEEFKKEIIESRRNGNIQVIWDAVGKENFDELNELFHIFYENFSGYKINHVLTSIMKKEETEQTKLYYDLIRKSKQILEKMRRHHMLNLMKEESEEEKTAKTLAG
ncbi:MAG: hypothetical protein J6X28_00265 [Bacilli bacterium]|nr:hypothetical protein [Bacilli bacterium]